MQFVSPLGFSRLEPPFFIGRIEGAEQSPESNLPEHVDLTLDHIETITYSLFFRQKVIASAFDYNYVDVPVESHQNVEIDKNAVIFESRYLSDPLYDLVGASPFPANFAYFPPGSPAWFEKTGTYVVRFEITTIDARLIPAECVCEVK